MSKQKEGGISWTDQTWYPMVGCSKVSAGCDHCWAERAAILHYHPDYPNGWDGHVKLFPDRLEQPLHWRKPRKIAVGLMGDWCHPRVPMGFAMQMLAIAALCPQHKFQFLTKRGDRMYEMLSSRDARDWCFDSATEIAHSIISQTGYLQAQADKILDDFGWPLPNVWLGVSVEDQKTFEERWGYLRRIKAAKRFISFEPLLGEIEMKEELWEDLGAFIWPDWAIVGSESGPGARPCDIEWIRSIVQQCKGARAAVHVKQIHINGKLSKNMDEWPADLRVREFPEVKL